MKEVLNQSEHAQLREEALAVKARLDGCSVGYGEKKQFDSLVSPRPYGITAADRDMLVRRGRVIRQWVEITGELYRASLDNEALFWLRDLLETGTTGEMLEYHRELYRRGPVRPPLFMRMDQPSFDRAVEAQTPGSGWGYHAALATCYEGYDVVGRNFVQSVAEALRRLTGKERPRVVHLLHKDAFYGAEAAFFAQAIRQAGIDFTISVRKIPADIGSYDVVFRHYLEELGQYEGWQQLFKFYLDGRIEIEPSPSLMTDHKVATMLPFHQQTLTCYPAAVRDLFPITVLADPMARFDFLSNGHPGPTSLSELASCRAKDRSVALKYSGLSPQKRAGGRAVYNLNMAMPEEVVTLIQSAIDDLYRGEPWLLQELVQHRFPVTYMTGRGEIKSQEMFARLNPFYSFPPSGGAELLGCPVHFRNFWKVHGQPDAVETILAVS